MVPAGQGPEVIGWIVLGYWGGSLLLAIAGAFNDRTESFGPG